MLIKGDMKSFQGKFAFITGGSSGIGRSLAEELARRGASVWIAARHENLLQQALERIEAARVNAAQSFGSLCVDVSDQEGVNQALSKFVQEVGVPDLVINSAGVAHPGQVEELPLDIFRWNMEVNYFGTVYVTKAFLPGMIARGSGHIVNISSVAGILGVYGYTAYGASKYAVNGFSDVLRAELKPLGVQVSIAFPADVDTPQLAYENRFKPAVTKELNGSGGLMTPDAVAKSILKGVQRNHYIITPGLQSTLFYYLVHFTGNLIYSVMDLLVAQAMRKNGSPKHNPGHQNGSDPNQV